MSQIALELLVFQEKNYGRGCQFTVQGMMVPMIFFYDFEPEGGFSKIITQVRLYCLKESLRKAFHFYFPCWNSIPNIGNSIRNSTNWAPFISQSSKNTFFFSWNVYRDNELELDKMENMDRGHQLFKMIRRSLKQKNKKIIYLSKAAFIN